LRHECRESRSDRRSRGGLDAIFNEVLKKYDTVVIEKNGKPVGVLKRPGTAGNVVRPEEF
jgi:hypothetical protein